MYKFEKLEVYQMALTCTLCPGALGITDMIYTLVEKLPRVEEGNLKPQVIRAATSIVLNIAEGSTSQSNNEQRRFLSMAIRSLLETVACQHLIERRKYVNREALSERYEFSQVLFRKLQALRRVLEKK